MVIDMKRYLIVGSGAAGYAAAGTIRRHDPGGEIVIFSAEEDGYYSRPALAYYLSREINKKSLYPLTKKDLEKQSINLEHKLITEINPEEKTIIDSQQMKMAYDKLLLATGAVAASPEIEGRSLDGVVYLDSLAQTVQIIRQSKRGKKALVVGGGITALEIVEGLLARKMEVHFLLRGSRYWNRVLDQQESELILSRLAAEGVRIHKNTEVKELVGRKGKLEAAYLSTGEKISTNLAAFAIGIRPRTTLASAAGLTVERGVRVNQFMETSRESIYAAGDVAEVYDPDTGNWVLDSLWPIARQHGIMAGKNMAGIKEPIKRRSPINVTRLAGLTTTIIGRVGQPAPEDECQIVRGESESWQLMPDAVVCQNNFDVNRLRLMVGKDILLGALLMGDQSLSRILEDLIMNQTPITPIREQLLSPGEDIRSILINYWQGNGYQ